MPRKGTKKLVWQFPTIMNNSLKESGSYDKKLSFKVNTWVSQTIDYEIPKWFRYKWVTSQSFQRRIRLGLLWARNLIRIGSKTEIEKTKIIEHCVLVAMGPNSGGVDLTRVKAEKIYKEKGALQYQSVYDILKEVGVIDSLLKVSVCKEYRPLMDRMTTKHVDQYVPFWRQTVANNVIDFMKEQLYQVAMMTEMRRAGENQWDYYKRKQMVRSIARHTAAEILFDEVGAVSMALRSVVKGGDLREDSNCKQQQLSEATATVFDFCTDSSLHCTLDLDDWNDEQSLFKDKHIHDVDKALTCIQMEYGTSGSKLVNQPSAFESSDRNDPGFFGNNTNHPGMYRDWTGIDEDDCPLMSQKDYNRSEASDIIDSFNHELPKPFMLEGEFVPPNDNVEDGFDEVSINIKSKSVERYEEENESEIQEEGVEEEEEETPED